MSMVGDWMGISSSESRRRLVLVGVVAAGLLATVAGVWVLPGSDGGNAEIEAQGSAARVDGFRGAQFGMDEKAVRAAISADFGKSEEAVKIIDNPVERTRVLVVRAPNLFADSGEAEIGYVFGYKSKALIQVNLLWGTPLTPDVTRTQLSAVAATLTRYFSAQGFAAHRVTRNKKLGNGGLLIFQGNDAKGHMVQLVQREEAAAGDRKRMTLRLAYIASPQSPDIFRIAKGAF